MHTVSRMCARFARATKVLLQTFRLKNRRSDLKLEGSREFDGFEIQGSFIVHATLYARTTSEGNDF